MTTKKSSVKSTRIAGPWTSAAIVSCVLALAILVGASRGRAQGFGQQDRPSIDAPIVVASDTVTYWTDRGVRVMLLQGNVFISQEGLTYRSEAAVIWIHEYESRTSNVTELELYLERDSQAAGRGNTQDEEKLFSTLQTSDQLVLKSPDRQNFKSTDSPLYQRGERRRARELGWPEENENPARLLNIEQVQFETTPLDPPLLPDGERDVFADSPPDSTRNRNTDQNPLLKWKLFQRGSRGFNLGTISISETEQALVLTGGINLIVNNVPRIGTVNIIADNAVLWTPTIESLRLGASQDGDEQQGPLEVYLEGNVVIRQQNTPIECARVYYDFNNSVAVMDHAEIQALGDKLRSPIRFRAQKLRQVSESRFIAQGTQATPSQFARPGYDIQTNQITLDRYHRPKRDSFTGNLIIDPETGQPETETRHLLTGTDTYLNIMQFPVFYWPYVEGVLEDFNTPLKNIKVRQSRTFGTQLLSTWDVFGILQREQPDLVRKWDLKLDYLSERGPAIGTELDYRGGSLLGIQGDFKGFLDSYWIYDTGLDRLGRGRIDVEPEDKFRGRTLFRHRHNLPDDLTLALEFSYISDINFLEQYFERDFEEDKDQETLLYLKQQRDNWALSGLIRARMLDWFPSTNSLPRFDHYLIGESLLSDMITYSTHSSLAYLDLRPADRSRGDITRFPTGPSYDGFRVDSLHELDLPFSLGPFRIVPYLSGRASAWGETISKESEERLYGATGARATMPLWKVYHGIQNDLFNVSGLAHKMVFSIEYMYAKSDVDHTTLPQYDELEEDSEQIFRQRFSFRDYTRRGRMLRPELDPRIYAIRTGLNTHAESVDDLHVLRFGVRQRLQTKRGMPGNKRIIDWVILDVNAAYFPDSDRDNFGEDFGLITHDFEWHIGDRTSVLSDGWFETFNDGPRMWSLGLFFNRPPRGSFYIGYTSLEPIGSQVLRGRYNYYMSPKWISSVSSSYDFGETRSLGHSLALTRIGADWIFQLALKYQPLRDDFSVGVSISPRILPGAGVSGSGQGRGVRGVRGGQALNLIDYAPVE